MPKLVVFSPQSLRTDNPPALEQFHWRFLADGDSWFTIGTFNLLANSNLLFELAFDRSACAVNCGYPGRTLRRMVELVHDPEFESLLFGATRSPWDALLISAGGNDLIAAVAVRPEGAAAGNPALRLLLLPAEWGPQSMGAARYVSEAGWQLLAEYLRANLDDLIALRDHPASQSKGVPIFMHTYAVPTPRDAGTAFGVGPWLLPAMLAYGIPEADRRPLMAELVGRCAQVMLDAAADQERFPNLQVFDSATRVVLEPAAANATGRSGDWVNEIHLTRAGYRKLGRAWSPEIEGHL